ncbi:hypothetical protein AX17_001577 [Amanita inopinata Kibby_2008]|nr:hypothetical protein AX17_001577 [Amanita inopinata Kibby_2008]
MENGNIESLVPYNSDPAAVVHDTTYFHLLNGKDISPAECPPLETTATHAQPQIPTPLSHNPSPILEDASQDVVVAVSTAFHPGAHGIESDVLFSSSDAVLFYVHSQVIMVASEMAFSSVLSASLSSEKYRNTIINIPEKSAVLNVILHTLYNTSCAQHSPSFETLATAVDCMARYNIEPKNHITRGTPLYTLLLSHAPLYPMDLYALAAHFGIEDLAKSTSSHLLSYPLPSITDALAQRIGAVYLKRLMCLHLGRNNALRCILLYPPLPHPPTKECGFTDQKKLTRAWALVSAYLAWDARADLSTHSMQSALNPLTAHLTCELCHETLQQRIKDVVVKWASVKVRTQIF